MMNLQDKERSGTLQSSTKEKALPPLQSSIVGSVIAVLLGGTVLREKELSICKEAKNFWVDSSVAVPVAKALFIGIFDVI